MNAWRPTSEEEIWNHLNSVADTLTTAELHFLEAIRIGPERWELHPWGDLGNGFWVVGLIGKTVLWYNDIERGYNVSSYAEYGRIGEYWCDQDDLSEAVRRIISLAAGGDVGASASPAIPPSG